MSALLALLSPKILAVIGGLVAVVAAWLHGRASGKSAAEAAQAQAQLNEVKDVKQIHDDVGALPPDAVDRELSTWDRR